MDQAVLGPSGEELPVSHLLSLCQPVLRSLCLGAAPVPNAAPGRPGLAPARLGAPWALHSAWASPCRRLEGGGLPLLRGCVCHSDREAGRLVLVLHTRGRSRAGGTCLSIPAASLPLPLLEGCTRAASLGTAWGRSLSGVSAW